MLLRGRAAGWECYSSGEAVLVRWRGVGAGPGRQAWCCAGTGRGAEHIEARCVPYRQVWTARTDALLVASTHSSPAQHLAKTGAATALRPSSRSRAEPARPLQLALIVTSTVAGRGTPSNSTTAWYRPGGSGSLPEPPDRVENTKPPGDRPKGTEAPGASLNVASSAQLAVACPTGPTGAPSCCRRHWAPLGKQDRTEMLVSLGLLASTRRRNVSPAWTSTGESGTACKYRLLGVPVARQVGVGDRLASEPRGAGHVE